MSTVSIPDDLFEAAARIAARTGRSLSTVIEDALRSTLAPVGKHPNDQRIVLLKDGAGGLLSGVNLDHSSQLLDLMDTSDAAD